MPRSAHQKVSTIFALSFADFSSQYRACSSLPSARSVSAAERIASAQKRFASAFTPSPYAPPGASPRCRQPTTQSMNCQPGMFSRSPSAFS